MAMSRANSNDSFVPVGSSAIIEDEIESEEMDEDMGKTIISEEENDKKIKREGGNCSSKNEIGTTFTIDQQQQIGSIGGSRLVKMIIF
jgi:hypothetical protein